MGTKKSKLDRVLAHLESKKAVIDLAIAEVKDAMAEQPAKRAVRRPKAVTESAA